MILGKIKKFLSVDNATDLSRRKFVRDAGALAALTVVGTSLPSLLKVKDKVKEIEEQILSGIVENQTFYIDETIFIEIDNLVIRNCTFIASKPLNPMIYAGKVSGLTIEYCKFNNQSSKDSQAIMFENTSSKIPTVDFKPTALTGKKINLPHGAGITGYKS